MEILRTPDDRFTDLVDYPFAPHYVQIDDLRVHYVDEGPAHADPVLLLHGEPSWSYLWRKAIPALADAGHRVIAPDLVGFGRSDKPTDRADYTYQRHVDWMRAVVEALGLTNITLVGHDWGGLIGLRLTAEDPDRYARIVAAHTALPTGDEPMGGGFLQWRQFSQEVPEFLAGEIVQMASATDIPADVRAAYDAPFPDERYKAGARKFPMLVPASPDDPASAANRAAWRVLRDWHKPFVTVFSATDQSFPGVAELFQDTIPGAKGQPHVAFENTGHFLPEDLGADLGRVLVDSIG